MKISRRALACGAVGITAATGARATETPCRYILTDGSRVSVLGNVPPIPRRTVMVIGTGIVYSIEKPDSDAGSFAQTMAACGWTVCGVSAPAHDEDDHLPGEPYNLPGFRWRLDHGGDLVGSLRSRASASIDLLVSLGYTDPARVAAAGFSRGAFCCLHWAAVDPRVKALALFYPLVDLRYLTEFAAPSPELVAAASALDARTLIPALQGRRVLALCNSWDTRVCTDNEWDLTRRLIAAHNPTNTWVPDITFQALPYPRHGIPLPVENPIGRDWLNARL